MANEDNRVSNLIGQPISDWALKQLNTRSNQNSLDTRSNGLDNSNIVYLANKTGWISLISSVDIKSSEVLQFLKSEYGVIVNDGPDLAKHFVLSGGTLAYNNGNFSLRSGLNSYNILGKNEISAYGFRPMPGITGVSIKTLGKLGSFRQAEIKFKVLDKYQLDIIDILYLRLGYTMLLQWGQTYYYSSDKLELKTTEDKYINGFDSDINKDNLRRKIASNIRDSEGNYDAMLGMVTNFNFTMTQDGGYDCSITLTSIGILGDSTRINVYANLKSELKKEINNLVSIITKLWKANEQKKLDEARALAQQQNQTNVVTKDPGILDNYPPCVKSKPWATVSVLKMPPSLYPRGIEGVYDGVGYIFYLNQTDQNSGELQVSGSNAKGRYECKGSDIFIAIGSGPLKPPIGTTFEDIITAYTAPTSTINPLKRTIGSGNDSETAQNEQVYFVPNDQGGLNQSKVSNTFVKHSKVDKNYYAFEFNKSLIPKDVTTYKTEAKLDISVLSKLPAFIQITENKNAYSNDPNKSVNPNIYTTVDVINILTSAAFLYPENKEININTEQDKESSYVLKYRGNKQNTTSNYVISRNATIIDIYYNHYFNISKTKKDYAFQFHYPSETSVPNDEITIQNIPYKVDKTGARSTDTDKIREQIKNALLNKSTIWEVKDIGGSYQYPNQVPSQWRKVVEDNFLITLTTKIPLKVDAVIYNTNTPKSDNVISLVDVDLDLTIRTNDPSIITSISVENNANLLTPTNYVNPSGTSQVVAAAVTSSAAPVSTIPTFDLDAIQQDNALKYRSAIEVMLRILQVHTYEQASKGGAGTSLITGDYTNVHVEGILKPGKDAKTSSTVNKVTRDLYNQLFGDGIFSRILNKLFDNDESIRPTDAQYKSLATTKLDRFKYDSAYGFHRGLLSDKVKIPEDAKKRKDFENKYLVNYAELTKTYLVPYKQSQDLIEGSNLNYPVYVSLGFFIMMLNHIATLYVNEDGENVTINTDIPLYYIDFNPESNFCLSNPVQFTTNPYNFLIPIEGTQKDYKALFPKNINTSKFWNTDNGDTLSKHIPKFRVSNGASNSLDSFKGKTMNVLVSIDYLLQVISTHTAKDSTNSVYLKPMLEEVISDMNKTFGNFNMLRLGFDDSADCFFISDDQLIPDDNMITSTTSDITLKAEIPIYGKNSIAKSFDIKTEVSSKLANVLAISANSDATSQANGGTDGSSFGVYNVSYFDRYKKILTSKNDTNSSTTGSGNSTEASAAQYAAELFDNSVKRYYNIADTKNSTSENMVSHTINYYIELMAKSKNENEGTRGSAMIPLSLNLSLDGMSGLGIGQAFTINEKLIPYRYTELSTNLKNKLTKVGFIITGVDHEFNANVWTTSIRSSMYYLKNIADYSSVLNANRPSLKGTITTSNTNIFIESKPWSAAFISYVMSNSGFSTFPVSAKHVNYLNELKNNQDFQMLDPNDTKVKMQVGDLVAYNRNNNTNTYNTSPWSGDSHVNIVVDVVGSKVNVIGGNVSQKVAYDNSYENGKSKPNVFVIVRPINIDKAKKAADIAKQQRNSWLKLIETQLDAQVFLRDYYRTVNLTLP
jgi:hypothetical protein